MNETSLRNQDKVSKVMLIVILVSVCLNIGSFYQTHYVLDSPLVPKSIVLDISRPPIFAALISIIGAIAALIAYFFSKFQFTIIICGVILAWQIYYLNWGAY